MATAAYYQPASARARSITPMSLEMSKMLPQIAERSVSRGMNRTPRSGRGAGGGMELTHARNMYNPARQSVCTRFTPNDWAASNVQNFQVSVKERNEAERLRAEAWRTVKATDQKTRVRQSDTTKKLADRAADIDHWRQELHEEERLMELEQENLKEHLRVLESALAHTAKPLHISDECLMHREKRVGIDQVHDDVEKQLIKESDVIKKCQAKMKKLIEKTCIQLKLNRAAQHELDKDAKDKGHAYGIDDKLHHLKNTSGGLGFHNGVEVLDNTVSIPDSWARFSQENIIRSQKCRAVSERLRGDIDQLLRLCANEMWCMFNAVNNSFNARIQETTNARNKLQSHLNRTMQEIFDVEKTIEILRKGIHDKQNPMKVAQTRLDERLRRLNIELCNDPVMKTLQREVYEIRDSIRALKDRLRLAEAAGARLNKTKSLLEHDIGVKENSLNIDNKLCMGMRKSFPMDPKVGPIFNMPLAY